MFPPFRHLEHFRVDLAAERHLGRMEALRNIREARGPDDHHVDIAARDLGATGHRPIHECNGYALLRG